jgi:hypothetical protein
MPTTYLTALADSAFLASVAIDVEYETRQLLFSAHPGLGIGDVNPGLLTGGGTPEMLPMAVRCFHDALLEAGLVHLRNLREFLIADGSEDDDVTATRLLKGWSSLRDRPGTAQAAAADRIREIATPLHKSLAHITSARLANHYAWDLPGATDDVLLLLTLLRRRLANKRPNIQPLNWVDAFASQWRTDRPSQPRYAHPDGRVTICPDFDPRFDQTVNRAGG